MSLAERKVKQRWSLNPRGKLWLEDTNNFGHKMLERMGWKHGKGLGANEQGHTEPLKVAYKCDNKGMGYKEAESWSAHGANFAELLGNLNGGSHQRLDEMKVTSLEKKAEKCRSRINYQKFLKAKDLTRLSEKDLANIFGKKSLKQQQNQEETTEVIVRNIPEEAVDEVLLNRGSMADYFKRKLPNFTMLNSKPVSRKRETESESDCERVGFGFRQSNKDSSCENIAEKKRKYEYEETEAVTSIDGQKTKKRKKESKKGCFVSYLNEESNAFETTKEEKIDVKDADTRRLNGCVEDVMEDKENGKRKKLKKSKSLEEDEIADVSHNEKSFIEEVEEGDTPKTIKVKRKSKKTVEDISGGSLECKEVKNEDGAIEESGTPINSSKKHKKKSKKAVDDIVQESLENNKEIHENEVIEEESGMTIKFSKKHLKKLKKTKEEIENAEHCVSSNIAVDGGEMKHERKRKKSKKCEENGIINAAFSAVFDQSETKGEIEGELRQFNVDGVETSREGDTSEVNVERSHRKKRKKSKEREASSQDNVGISNPAFDDASNPNGTCEETPRKKKKKRKDEENNGIDNPMFVMAADISQTPDSSSPNPYEFKANKKKEKRKIIEGLENPALNLSDSIVEDDLILNVTNTPVILKKPVDKFALNSNVRKVKSVSARRKSVRFSDVLQERIIPNDPSERSNEYLSNRNELFDINTMVIEEGLKEEMEKQGMVYEKNENSLEELRYLSDPKEISKKMVESSVKEELNRSLQSEQCSFLNNGFDIRSVDKIDFYNDKYEVKISPGKEGIDNQAFNKLKNRIEENVMSISNAIDGFQAEVENDMNEAKANGSLIEDWLVGDVGSQISGSMKVKHGLKLSFKEMHFKTPVPHYLRGNVSRAKKSYRHLIRGDITIGFKNSNLHEIPGYAVGGPSYG